MSNRDHADAVAVLALAGLWVSLCLVIQPAGDFPLNDDWSYAQIVKRLVEQGTLDCTGWLAISLVGHILWGALFCLPAGFSFDALRLSGQLAGGLGVCVLYGLLRRHRVRRGISFFAALLLALNPLYFNLAQTFMSDIPSLTLSLLALGAYLRALDENRVRSAGWGTLAAAAAVWFRQTALLIPAAFLCAILLSPDRRRWILPALGSCAAVLLSLAACDALLLQHDHAAILYHYREKELLGTLLSPLRTLPLCALQAGNILTYLGLFLAPLLLLLPGAPVLRPPNRRAIFAGLAVGGISAVAALASPPIPFQGNIVNLWGLGAPTLHDIGIHEQAPFVLFPYALRILLTAAGVAAITLIAYRSAADGPTDSASRSKRTLLLVFSIGMLLLLSSIQWLDRHILPVFASLILLTALDARRGESPRAAWRPPAALAALAAAGALSVLGTQDYLAWNRARWKALDRILAQGIPPNRIDGGFEFNGWYGYDRNYRPDPKTDPERRSWWWVDRDDVVVALSPLAGYSTQVSDPYPSWLRPNARVYVLQKEPHAR